jgi:hypothetical protein
VAKAWVIRAGQYGERDQWALDNSVSGGGWQEYPDLTPYDTKEKIAKLVQTAYQVRSPRADRSDRVVTVAVPTPDRAGDPGDGHQPADLVTTHLQTSAAAACHSLRTRRHPSWPGAGPPGR